MKKSGIFFLVLIVSIGCLQAEEVDKKLRLGFLAGWSLGFSSDTIRGDIEYWLFKIYTYHYLDENLPTLDLGAFLERQLSHRFALQLQADVQFMTRYYKTDIYLDEVLIEPGERLSPFGYTHFNLTLNLIYNFPRIRNGQIFIKGGIGPTFKFLSFIGSWEDGFESGTDFLKFDHAFFHVQAGGGVKYFVGREKRSNFQLGAMLHYLIGQDQDHSLKGIYLTLFFGYQI